MRFIKLTFRKILPFLIKSISSFIIAYLIGDGDFIKSVYADSEDESADEVKPIEKKDKGKGRATEFVPDKGKDEKSFSPDRTYSDEESAYFSKQEQEKYDFELAKRLQDEEYELEAPSISKTKSLSDYSVLSSEIHSDDDDETKRKKLEVRDYENSIKRPHVEEPGESSNKKRKK